MALLVLVMSLDMNVKFHFCREDHHVSVSFGDASRLCAHCAGHHHNHVQTHDHEVCGLVKHFDAKCCCEDFEETIGFIDQFTFSTENALAVFLPSTLLTNLCQVVFEEKLTSVSHLFTQLKIPYLLTGRLKTIFFSNLKINPLI